MQLNIYYFNKYYFVFFLLTIWQPTMFKPPKTCIDIYLANVYEINIFKKTILNWVTKFGNSKIYDFFGKLVYERAYQVGSQKQKWQLHG